MKNETFEKRETDRGVVSRTRAVMSLGEGDKTRLQQLVGRYLADRSPRVRAAALDVVRERELRKMDASVLGLLTDKSGIVRHAAVECLGVLHEGEAVEASWLYPLLKDPFLVVRIETLESLAEIGDRTALPLIAERLKDDDPLVRAYAARSIAELKSHEFMPAIERASEIEKDENAQVGFADALFALGDESQFAVLLKFLSSTNYHVRCASANALSAAELTQEQLQFALEAVSHAARHALAEADRSRMERVEKELREQL